MTGPLPAPPSPTRPTTPRQVADRYVEAVCDLDPIVATSLGSRPGDDRLPDFSPAGLEADAELDRRTLAALDALGPVEDAVERRCARLLRERLSAQLAVHEAGEGYRTLSNLFSPIHSTRQVFALMPTAGEEDWEVVGRRLARVPEAYRGFAESLREGVRRGLLAAPRQVATVVGQLDEWLAGPYFTTFVADGPARLGEELRASAAAADAAVAEVRDFLRDEYAPATAGTPDAVGRERYALAVRRWTGSDLGAGSGLEDAYAWGWAEHRRILDEQELAAGKVLAGGTPAEARRWLHDHGPAVEGVEAIRAHLQALMDRTITELDGEHFDLAEPIRRVEAMIAPPGSAAAPYYTRPAQDFSRPGRTWLPTLGRTRFPLWDLVSTWYHEGVPGHHLQLAQWALVSGQLSTYQTSIGQVSADAEGWALYAERLMDELGYFADPGERLGFLDEQQLRAIRVVIDIGMHLRLAVPQDAEGVLAEHRGRPWSPELARAFLAEHTGAPAEMLDSEVVRYLGIPGQAIGYKLGERAWREGREAAQQACGAAFDLKSWHMAALSQGSLGLDDLAAELAQL
ncbi:DUF885 domain-containing protein [Blastococcus saxobsidens]|uniref:Uncharacterized protein (DUF885 family) n=1 Tax=Blastococcus saxobsidens TaxID=138336 RepID=A0A4V2G2I9_9ACTN|nr:DUF885 domain-containing protein [Blastococcus saxobsidens]RZU33336.1 uncharacterized protein (DUF885 family) [Blastococcus saxobsidens]